MHWQVAASLLIHAFARALLIALVEAMVGQPSNLNLGLKPRHPYLQDWPRSEFARSFCQIAGSHWGLFHARCWDCDSSLSILYTLYSQDKTVLVLASAIRFKRATLLLAGHWSSEGQCFFCWWHTPLRIRAFWHVAIDHSLVFAQCRRLNWP